MLWAKNVVRRMKFNFTSLSKQPFEDARMTKGFQIQEKWHGTSRTPKNSFRRKGYKGWYYKKLAQTQLFYKNRCHKLKIVNFQLKGF